MGKLVDILLSRDTLGHPVSINYKGSDTFQTKLGAFISIIIQLMTMAIFVIKATELVQMSDPSLQLYSRPIYEVESSEQGDLNLAENKVKLGIVTDFLNGDLDQIPPSIGRIESYTKYFPQDGSPITETPQGLVPCSGLFDDVTEEISTQIQATAEKALCFDPEIAAVNGSSLHNASKTLRLEFIPCLNDDDIEDKEEQCEPSKDLEDWLEENPFKLKILYTFNFVDMSLPDEPLRTMVAQNQLGGVKQGNKYEFYGILGLHEIDLNDELINPFPTSNSVSYYLNFGEFDVSSGEGGKSTKTYLFEFEAEIYLGEIYYIEVRQRYNIWDLLGDVGGFHDGLYIVFSLFMGSYSALAFRVDFLKSTRVDSGSDERAQRDRQKSASIELLKVNQDCTVDKQTLSLFGRTIKQIVQPKESMIQGIFCCLRACRSKTKKERLSGKVMDRMDHNLDIRHLLRHLMMLKLLVKHIMTPQQQLLLAYQRRRYPSLVDNSGSEEEKSTDEDFTSKMMKKQFVSGLLGFETKSQLDRNLLLGVFKRDPFMMEAKQEASAAHVPAHVRALSQLSPQDSVLLDYDHPGQVQGGSGGGGGGGDHSNFIPSKMLQPAQVVQMTAQSPQFDGAVDDESSFEYPKIPIKTQSAQSKRRRPVPEKQEMP